jgi:hypothetical protein
MNPPFYPPSVFPSANPSPFHLPHTETCQWGPHPSSLFPEISALPGALMSHWGTCFCILYIFPTFIHYLLYKGLLFPVFTFVVTVGDPLSFWPHTTHVTLGWSITFHLPSLTSSISSEYYPGHLPLTRHAMWIQAQKDTDNQYLRLRYCITLADIEMAIKDREDDWRIPVLIREIPT